MTPGEKAGEARRSGHCCVTDVSHPLSLPLSLSLSALSAALDGKTMMVTVRERNQEERLLCAKQLLGGEETATQTERGEAVRGRIMAPICRPRHVTPEL